MFKFEQTHIINKPIQEVFDFFENPENLELITPPDLKFKIKTPKPLVMKKGAIFNYEISFGILKIPWETLITEYIPSKMFQDEQRKGPYKKWIHTHEFIDLDDKTKMIDTVEYDLYPAILSKLINHLYIKSQIEKIFHYRKTFLERLFNQ